MMSKDVYVLCYSKPYGEGDVALAITLEEENKLIEAGFEYVRYSEKHDVAICRKPK